MLQPKLTKFKKSFRPDWSGSSHSYISFGNFALKAIEPGRLTPAHLESIRRVLTRFIKKQGNIWIRVFPHHPLSKKPLQARMGGGKGSFDHWVANIKENQIIVEFTAPISINSAKVAAKIVESKLPLKTKFIFK